MPIISGGDITGSVISLTGGEHHTAELEAKLIQTAASFLAKQLEE